MPLFGGCSITCVVVGWQQVVNLYGCYFEFDSEDQKYVSALADGVSEFDFGGDARQCVTAPDDGHSFRRRCPAVCPHP